MTTHDAVTSDHAAVIVDLSDAQNFDGRADVGARRTIDAGTFTITAGENETFNNPGNNRPPFGSQPTFLNAFREVSDPALFGRPIVTKPPSLSGGRAARGDRYQGRHPAGTAATRFWARLPWGDGDRTAGYAKKHFRPELSEVSWCLATLNVGPTTRFGSFSARR
jgi:hypothetical protein